MRPLIVFMILMTAWVCYAAQDMPVSGKHLENEISCEDCHESKTPDSRAPVSTCKNCHGDYPDIAELTSGFEHNPHDSHLGQLRCTLCHKTHEPSVLHCNQCHSFDMKVN